MPADLLLTSLGELRRTAELLEAGPGAAAADPLAPAVTTADRSDPAPHEHRSLARFAARSLVHTAITVSLLTGACLVVDPLLPQGERPQLSARVSAPSAPDAIPPKGTNRP